MRQRFGYRTNNNVLCVRGPQPLPPQLRTSFRVVGKIVFELTATTEAAGIYSGNSLFDPFSTSGTSQPQMFDELTNFYDRYNVLYSVIEITASTSSQTEETILSIAPVMDTTSAYTFSTLQNIPGYKSIVIGSNESNSVKTLRSSATSAKIWGKGPGADDLSAHRNQNPGAQWWWYVNASCLNQTNSSTYHINFILKITYHCLLSTPHYVAIS